VADLMVEVSEAPRRVFERIVVRRNSLRGAGKRCGRSNMWIWRQLRQNKSVDLIKTGKVMAQLDVPMRFFYEEMLDESPPYDPIWVLEHYREGNDLPRDSFLAAVHDRLLALLDMPPTAGGKRRLSEIAVLDESRYFDREAAKKDLECLSFEILSSAEAAPAPRRSQLADCAHLLMIWGAMQRARGHLDDATDAYMVAYRLAIRGRDPRPLGIFYYYASHLLSHGFAQPAHGLRFAEQACAIFQQVRDRDLHSQGLVQTGVALFDLGRFDEARSRCIAALRMAPRRAWRTRGAAWIQLGNLAMERGHLRSALGKMVRAGLHSRRSNYMRAFVLWREGVILKRLGRTASAARAYRDAIRYFERVGQAFDVAMVAIDLTEMLMSAGCFGEALAIVKAMAPRFERLSGGYGPAISLWLDLVALILQGAKERSLVQVGLLRQALEKADPKIRLAVNR
jgi:tetratricopeptide (TPR) repeat protein